MREVSDLEEEPVRLRVLAERAVDQLERAGDLLHRVRVEGEVVAVGEVEDADQVDRIAREDLSSAMLMRLLSTTKSVVSGILWCAPASDPEEAVERRRRLAVMLLERRAEDVGEVADFLGDQEVVLHEALDVLEAGMGGVAEPHRHAALDVEGEPLLGAAGHEVEVAAHRPQEIV